MRCQGDPPGSTHGPARKRHTHTQNLNNSRNTALPTINRLYLLSLNAMYAQMHVVFQYIHVHVPHAPVNVLPPGLQAKGE